MGKGLIAALCLFVLAVVPARAWNGEALQGQWSMFTTERSSLGPGIRMGVVVIDAQGRATLNGADELGAMGAAKSRGYVKVNDTAVEIILTNGIRVEHITCVLQSSDLLHCHWAISTGGTASAIFTRVGPGPKDLTSTVP
jgi:hypothetical protein